MYRRFLRKPAYHTIVSQKYHQLHPTRWCPPSYVNVSLENPHEYYSNISPPFINPNVIILMFTNFSRVHDLGHHLAPYLHNVFPCLPMSTPPKVGVDPMKSPYFFPLKSASHFLRTTGFHVQNHLLMWGFP